MKVNGSDDIPLIRIKDIASSLGVAPPSVVEYVQRLKDENLVEVIPRKGIIMTEAGIKEANILKNRYKIVQCFFQNILKVDTDLSTDQAHKIEHLLDQKVIRNLYDHIDAIIGCPNEKCQVGEMCIPQ
jgi:Mn-dependent DtxR family transcriptional regulator